MIINKEFILKFNNDDFGYIDAFGLDLEFKFNPFNNLELPDTPPDITHIIGESGSGKSQLSKILADSWGLKYPIYPSENIVCCELLGISKELVDKMIYYLNYVGLSDARLYYTKYEFLSDSQKFRAMLAFNLALYKDMKVNGFVFDEFLSTLDRDTAKSVACLLTKLVRKDKIKVILTTAHEDLICYITPDLLIRGYAFPERFEIVTDKIQKCTIDYNIEISNKEEYKNCRLGELHYKGKYTGGSKEYFKVINSKNNKVIGWLVTAVVGKDIEMKRRIARVIVHPSYRGIGIGTALVKYYINWAKYNSIDKIYAVSALGMFNPFFELAGMVKCKNYEIKPKSDFTKQLIKNGFNVDMWFSKDYCVYSCESQNIRDVVATLAKGAIRVINPGGKKLTEDEEKQFITTDASHAGRYLWTLRPRVLAKYRVEL